MLANNKFLLAILILSAILRLVMLEDFQPGFFRDETAIGYNAYSIAKTGSDEYGVFLPKVFRSIEVYFLPAYIYITAGIIKLIGLSIFSVRLLSALSGIAIVYLSYEISRILFNKYAGLFSAFLMAISPWAIFYSRGTFEGNLGVALFMFGFLFWIKALKSDFIKNSFLSGLFFTLSMYSYQAERLVVPLFAVVAIALSYKVFLKNSNKLILPVILLVVFMLPLLSITFQAGGYHRGLGVSILSTQTDPQGWIQESEGGIFINNRLFLQFKNLGNLYLSYFSPKNLFNDSDANLQRAAVDFSVYYSWMIVPLIVSVFALLKNYPNKNIILLATWIFIAPIPAAITGDPFHTYRSLLLYPPLVILMGYGLDMIYKKYNKKTLAILIAISTISLSSFIYSYIFLTPALRASEWDYGYGELTEFILDNKSTVRQIVVDDPLTEGYINYLFFSKTDPVKYQNEVYDFAGNPLDYYYTNPDVIRPDKVENVYFRKVDWPTERGDSGTIFLMHAKSLPESEFQGDPKIQLLKEFYYPNGDISFRALLIK